MSTTSIQRSFAPVALAALAALVQGCVSPSVDSDPEEVTAEAEQALTPSSSKKICDLFGAGTNGEYEASGVQVLGNDLYVVFDNKNKIGKIPRSLVNGSASYTPGTLSSGSDQYEGITFDSNNTQHFYAVQELASPMVVQLDGAGSAQGEVYQSVTTTAFGTNNKWFEGLAWLFRNNNDYLLALCQTGNCDASTTSSVGNLRVLAQSGSSWVWENNQVVKICSDPPACTTGPFTNYSDVALWPRSNGTFKMAIVSRGTPKIWIGTLSGTTWTTSGGTLYTLPSDLLYLEGVTFIDETHVAMVSDSDGTTSGSCADGTTDESVHLLTVP